MAGVAVRDLQSRVNQLQYKLSQAEAAHDEDVRQLRQQLQVAQHGVSRQVELASAATDQQVALNRARAESARHLEELRCANTDLDQLRGRLDEHRQQIVAMATAEAAAVAAVEALRRELRQAQADAARASAEAAADRVACNVLRSQLSCQAAPSAPVPASEPTAVTGTLSTTTTSSSADPHLPSSSLLQSAASPASLPLGTHTLHHEAAVDAAAALGVPPVPAPAAVLLPTTASATTPCGALTSATAAAAASQSSHPRTAVPSSPSSALGTPLGGVAAFAASSFMPASPVGWDVGVAAVAAAAVGHLLTTAQLRSELDRLRDSHQQLQMQHQRLLQDTVPLSPAVSGVGAPEAPLVSTNPLFAADDYAAVDDVIDARKTDDDVPPAKQRELSDSINSSSEGIIESIDGQFTIDVDGGVSRVRQQSRLLVSSLPDGTKKESAELYSSCTAGDLHSHRQRRATWGGAPAAGSASSEARLPDQVSGVSVSEGGARHAMTANAATLTAVETSRKLIQPRALQYDSPPCPFQAAVAPPRPASTSPTNPTIEQGCTAQRDPLSPLRRSLQSSSYGSPSSMSSLSTREHSAVRRRNDYEDDGSGYISSDLSDVDDEGLVGHLVGQVVGQCIAYSSDGDAENGRLHEDSCEMLVRRRSRRSTTRSSGGSSVGGGGILSVVPVPPLRAAEDSSSQGGAGCAVAAPGLESAAANTVQGAARVKPKSPNGVGSPGNSEDCSQPAKAVEAAAASASAVLISFCSADVAMCSGPAAAEVQDGGAIIGAPQVEPLLNVSALVSGAESGAEPYSTSDTAMHAAVGPVFDAVFDAAITAPQPHVNRGASRDSVQACIDVGVCVVQPLRGQPSVAAFDSPPSALLVSEAPRITDQSAAATAPLQQTAALDDDCCALQGPIVFLAVPLSSLVPEEATAAATQHDIDEPVAAPCMPGISEAACVAAGHGRNDQLADLVLLASAAATEACVGHVGAEPCAHLAALDAAAVSSLDELGTAASMSSAQLLMPQLSSHMAIPPFVVDACGAADERGSGPSVPPVNGHDSAPSLPQLERAAPCVETGASSPVSDLEPNVAGVQDKGVPPAAPLATEPVALPLSLEQRSAGSPNTARSDRIALQPALHPEVDAGLAQCGDAPLSPSAVPGSASQLARDVAPLPDGHPVEPAACCASGGDPMLLGAAPATAANAGSPLLPNPSSDADAPAGVADVPDGDAAVLVGRVEGLLNAPPAPGAPCPAPPSPSWRILQSAAANTPKSPMLIVTAAAAAPPPLSPQPTAPASACASVEATLSTVAPLVLTTDDCETALNVDDCARDDPPLPPAAVPVSTHVQQTDNGVASCAPLVDEFVTSSDVQRRQPRLDEDASFSDGGDSQFTLWQLSRTSEGGVSDDHRRDSVSGRDRSVAGSSINNSARLPATLVRAVVEGAAPLLAEPGSEPGDVTAAFGRSAGPINFQVTSDGGVSCVSSGMGSLQPLLSHDYRLPSQSTTVGRSSPGSSCGGETADCSSVSAEAGSPISAVKSAASLDKPRRVSSHIFVLADGSGGCLNTVHDVICAQVGWEHGLPQVSWERNAGMPPGAHPQDEGWKLVESATVPAAPELDASVQSSIAPDSKWRKGSIATADEAFLTRMHQRDEHQDAVAKELSRRIIKDITSLADTLKEVGETALPPTNLPTIEIIALDDSFTSSGPATVLPAATSRRSSQDSERSRSESVSSAKQQRRSRRDAIPPPMVQPARCQSLSRSLSPMRWAAGLSARVSASFSSLVHGKRSSSTSRSRSRQRSDDESAGGLSGGGARRKSRRTSSTSPLRRTAAGSNGSNATVHPPNSSSTSRGEQRTPPLSVATPPKQRKSRKAAIELSPERPTSKLTEAAPQPAVRYTMTEHVVAGASKDRQAAVAAHEPLVGTAVPHIQHPQSSPSSDAVPAAPADWRSSSRPSPGYPSLQHRGARSAPGLEPMASYSTDSWPVVPAHGFASLSGEGLLDVPHEGHTPVGSRASRSAGGDATFRPAADGAGGSAAGVWPSPLHTAGGTDSQPAGGSLFALLSPAMQAAQEQDDRGTARQPRARLPAPEFSAPVAAGLSYAALGGISITPGRVSSDLHAHTLVGRSRVPPQLMALANSPASASSSASSTPHMGRRDGAGPADVVVGRLSPEILLQFGPPSLRDTLSHSHH